MKGIDKVDNFDKFLFSGQDCEYLDVETYHRFKTLVEESLIALSKIISLLI